MPFNTSKIEKPANWPTNNRLKKRRMVNPIIATLRKKPGCQMGGFREGDNRITELRVFKKKKRNMTTEIAAIKKVVKLFMEV